MFAILLTTNSPLIVLHCIIIIAKIQDVISRKQGNLYQSMLIFVQMIKRQGT